MKKIFTLTFMVLFCCLGAMAEIVLGDIQFSLGEGKKISPTTGAISILFPNVAGVDDPTAVNFTIEGNFNDNPDWRFDGLEGSFASGVTLELADFELTPSTDITLTVTSVKVDGQELAPAEGYVLHFKTRSAERKMAWTFTMDEESAAKIKEGAIPDDKDGDQTKYMDMGSQRFYVPACNYEEILLPDGSSLTMTEDLLFKFGFRVFYVGDSEGNHKDRIAFNGNDQFMVVPDCQVGDVISFNANRSTKASASKRTCIQAMGGALAPEGLEASTGIKDSIQLGSSFTNFKFEVQEAGDITFRFSNCLLKSIEITEAQPKLPRNYNVVAGYVDGDNVTVLKELVAKTEGLTGSTVKVDYSYWLTDSEGHAYTYGAKGSTFTESFELKNGEGDTTFVIPYKKMDIDGVVYASEGEDIAGAALCTSGNFAIRSSMCKAAYFEENVKLVTLQPGSYKIRAILFDKKPASYVCTLTKGEGEQNEIYLAATADNWTEAESELLEITSPTDITLLAGGDASMGLDCIMIYASTDAPDDPEDPAGINEVNGSAQKAATRKVMKDGKIVIVTEAGTFNAIGVQVK